MKRKLRTLKNCFRLTNRLASYWTNLAPNPSNPGLVTEMPAGGSPLERLRQKSRDLPAVTGLYPPPNLDPGLFQLRVVKPPRTRRFQRHPASLTGTTKPPTGHAAILCFCYDRRFGLLWLNTNNKLSEAEQNRTTFSWYPTPQAQSCRPETNRKQPLLVAA